MRLVFACDVVECEEEECEEASVEASVDEAASEMACGREPVERVCVPMPVTPDDLTSHWHSTAQWIFSLALGGSKAASIE